MSLFLFSVFRINFTFLASYFLSSKSYYSFIVLSNEFININTLLFIRAAPLEPAMIVLYSNPGIYDSLRFHLFTIPSDETGLELTLMFHGAANYSVVERKLVQSAKTGLSVQALFSSIVIDIFRLTD